MTRFCVIGDSHIGPLRHAVVDAGLGAPHEFTFFAAHASLFPHLTLDGDRLTTNDPELRVKLQMFSGGKDEINIFEYDRFVIIGLGCWIGAVAYPYRDYVSDGMKDDNPNKYLLSDACFAALCERGVMDSEALRLARLIRAICDKPVMVAPAPNPGVGVAEDQVDAWFPPVYEILRNGDDQKVAALFQNVCASISTKYGVTLFPPLAEAAANGVFNKTAFCLLSEQSDADNRKNLMGAMTHASTFYGAVLAEHVLGRF